MALPYTFGTQTGTIPLNELDENFTYLEQLVPPLATSAVTVTASAQPNVRSLGTLTSLNCTGTITSGTVTANLINGTLQTSSQTNITAVGTLSSLTVSGSLNGTLSTAAQPNITSLGTLSSLNVSGNVSGNNFTASGTANVANLIVTGAGTVGTTLDVTGNITGGNVIATNFVGSGTQLTDISGPIVMAYHSENQNLTTGATVLKYTTTTVNTSNFYNTSTGLFIPLVPGYYQVNLTMAPELISGSPTATFQLGLYKNGTIVSISPTCSVEPTTPILSNNNLSAIVYLDGVSDYLGMAYISTIVSGNWRTAVNGVTSYFQTVWVHA